MSIAILLAGLASPAIAQAPAPSATPINVFLDCQSRGCDSDHFRTEIPFVNWVRDRTVGDVHLLITSQETGSGGAAYVLAFFGLRSFEEDTLQLTMSTPQTATSAERRDALTNRIAQGLLRYAIHTTAAERVTVRLPNADDNEGATGLLAGVKDPWNHWVFSLGGDVSADGEQQQASQSFHGNVKASRVTEAWKFEVGASGSYRENRYDLEESELTVVRRDYSSRAGAAKALAAQWSAGALIEAGTSTFRNQDLHVRLSPALEYSFYPYSEFSRRRITLQYSVGFNHFDYTEITLFDKTEERVVDEKLELGMKYQQPWGEAGLDISGSHYFHDLSRYELGVEAGLDVRIFKGLEAEVKAEYSRVHNQLYIQKGDASDEDVLTERLALATGYQYDFSVGLRYTFGSIFNNVVNRRFD
ncbi:MAG: hypothetical protein ABIV28_05975 [Longimicrobiales bacterium]